MAEETFTVNTDFEQVQLFMQWAEKYKNDFALPEMRGFVNAELSDVVDWLIENYRQEEGEIIVRPRVLLQIVQKTGAGLDCDDSCIFLAAWARFHGVPASSVIIAELDDEKNSHIFCGIETLNGIVWLDNLPGSIFGVHNYDERFLKYSRMSDYL